MNLGLKNKIALITGSSRGIGKAEALSLAGEGAVVYLTDKEITEPLKQAVNQINDKGGLAFFEKLDVTNEIEVNQMVEKIVTEQEKIDILINNASLTGSKYVGPQFKIDCLNLEDWNEMLSVALTGSFICTKFVARHMIKNKWGRIINTSSIHGFVGSGLGSSHYAAAKAGLIGLTKSASKELGPFGITVNAIAPGFIRTETLADSSNEDELADYAKQVPLRRLGNAGDVSALVTFLCSNQAGFINSETFPITGGRMEYSYGRRNTH